MYKVMLIFGTRPEAIKLCPLIHELRKNKEIETSVCITGQHRELLTMMLDIFSIRADYNLQIMQSNQTLYDITVHILEALKEILHNEHPDIVVVHGDTTTAFVAALACFYEKITVAHVEAGLRTHDIYAPYPEEFNRQAIGLISKLNFAPTEWAKNNLLQEGKNEKSIFVTGNTVIDAFAYTITEKYYNEELEWAKDSKLILLTTHRRENIGKPMENIFKAIKNIVNSNRNVKVIYPIHPNPIIKKMAYSILGQEENIHIIEPLNIYDFHNILKRSFLVLTDSGGIQEEAPALGVPALVLRNVTERPEGIQSGNIKLIGTEEKAIINATNELLNNPENYASAGTKNKIYGDGRASERISDILYHYMKSKSQ